MIPMSSFAIWRVTTRNRLKRPDCCLRRSRLSGRAFICREVAIEVVWVLERAYKFTRSQIADVILELAATGGIIIEEVEDVVHAAIRYRQTGADFSDLMILAAAERMGAGPLYTFDRRLARVDGATLLEAGQP